jgi:hypothetical protein
VALVSRRPLFPLATLSTAVAFLAVFAGTAAAVPLSSPAPTCTGSAYAYAGLYSNAPAPGIEANVTALAQVPYGHVAGWIGVGGPNAGPGGQAEWLQTGLVTLAGNGSELYAEITQPGLSPRYLTLASEFAPGTTYRLAVVRVPDRPDAWQVMVDGKPATDPVSLPGSSGVAPMAMSESWNGGMPNCNGFSSRREIAFKAHG